MMYSLMTRIAFRKKLFARHHNAPLKHKVEKERMRIEKNPNRMLETEWRTQVSWTSIIILCAKKNQEKRNERNKTEEKIERKQWKKKKKRKKHCKLSSNDGRKNDEDDDNEQKEIHSY